MQGLRAFGAMLASLLLANGLLWHVLSANLDEGIYPPEADSIGIPMMSAIGGSFVALLAVGVAVSLPRRGRVWRLVGSAFAVFATLLALLLALAWCSPHHFLAAAGFLTMALASAWSWWQARPV
ncbi:hypothetical protein KGA65_00880 [Ideonella sp. B7]|uniref:hypothetical protein n=1 Tax=Ideonella benzenivorans TaxID=2831643 RepID=UPI001CEC9222|nr:hypothetical protein [Ideonella benzenivorans]MCA6215081.1 hypothetical protein [Ideonella benzenivorans]